MTTEMLLPPLEAIDKELAERSLSEFIKLAWPIIEPGTDYLHNWHIDCICEYLQAVDGGQIKRLLINMPPRYMKSIVVSVMWPVWSWIKHPSLRWMFATYSQKLSTDHSVDRRTIIQSDWYQRLWSDNFALADDQNEKTEFINNHRGRMFATSFEGMATGKGGNRLVIDDAHDPKKTESDKQREKTITTFQRKLSSRLNNKKEDAIVGVAQRVHAKDLYQVMIDQGYTHLCLPAEDAPGKVISTPSGKQFVRDDTGYLWPEREGKEELKLARASMTEYGYAGQYQQRPSPLGGGKFKEKWFRRYTIRDGFYVLGKGTETWPVPITACTRFAQVDPAGAEKTEDNKPCFTVIQVWDVAPSYDMVLVHQFRENVETPDAADAIVRVCREFDVPWVGVERDGIGLGVIQTVRRKGIAVRPIKARGNKEARTETAEIRMKAGMIHFPANAPWLLELETELSQFPRSEFMDQVDTLAYAAMHVQAIGGAPRNSSDDEHLNDDVHEAKQAAKQADAEDNRPGKQIDPQSIQSQATGNSEIDDMIRKWEAGEEF